MSSEPFPEEIMILILVRLPARSLLRFRSVSRSWNSLITSKSFITFHLHHSLEVRNPLIHLYNYNHFSSAFRRKLYGFYRDDGGTLTKDQELEFPIENEPYNYSAACNGLLCFSYIFESRLILALWNPSIRKCYRFRCPTWPITTTSPCDVGIGYDSLTNEYKVLTLANPLWLGRGLPILFDVMVYVLGIDKWRRVNTHVPLSAMFLFGFPTFVHGCIHWIGYRWNQYAIVAFDVHVEAFLEIGLPSEIVQASGYALIAHGESLCLLDNRYDRAPGAVPIWVMKQYGVKQSWFKQFNIEMHGYYFRVLGFWQHDNILLENNRREVVSYDPKVQSTKLVLASEEGMHLVPKYDLAIPYMECLVLLKGSDGLESHVDGSSSNI